MNDLDTVSGGKSNDQFTVLVKTPLRVYTVCPLELSTLVPLTNDKSIVAPGGMFNRVLVVPELDAMVMRLEELAETVIDPVTS